MKGIHLVVESSELTSHTRTLTIPYFTLNLTAYKIWRISQNEENSLSIDDPAKLSVEWIFPLNPMDDEMEPVDSFVPS